jgi:hypothetical protein
MTDLIANFQGGDNQARACIIFIPTELFTNLMFDWVDWPAKILGRKPKT